MAAVVNRYSKTMVTFLSDPSLRVLNPCKELIMLTQPGTCGTEQRYSKRNPLLELKQRSSSILQSSFPSSVPYYGFPSGL